VLDARAVQQEAARLSGAPAEAILKWALSTFPGRAAVSVSFGGAGGIALAHMLSEIDRSVPVLFIDTEFLFPETLAFKDEFVARYGLTVRDLRPAHDVGPLYATDPDACCQARRVDPLDRALGDYDAWASALRRDQSSSRATTDIVEYHERQGRPVVKVHPIAHWSRADVARYLRDHNVPSHPLLDRGYTSIGCWPCTSPNANAADERAGRWPGRGKTECGLHTFTVRSGAS
jgi:phosphoadenosine phosphosulfate reductase